MGAKPYKWEKQDMLGMSLYPLSGNGDAVNVSIDGPANAAFKKGEKLFYERVGQLICPVYTAMKIIMVIIFVQTCSLRVRLMAFRLIV